MNVCIQTIKNIHNGTIIQFITLKNGLIASYSNDKNIKIWSF